MMPMRSPIREPLGDELIEAREHVADVAAAHVADDERRELPPATSRAAHVGIEDRVAVLDQREGAVARRGVLEGPDGAAVDVQDRREGRLAPRRA